MKRLQLLKKLDEEWEALKGSYAGLPDATMLETGVTGDWSVKDIIAHVTTWEEQALECLPLIQAGVRPPRYFTLYGGIDAFNALMTEKKGKLSLAEVLRQRDDTHQQLIEYIQNLPEEQLASDTRFRHRLRMDSYHHYREHAEAIHKWRGNQPAA
jgi:hypothetical protein